MRDNRTTEGSLTGSAFARAAIPIGLVPVALVVTISLRGILSTSGFLFFYAAIVLSAWFGGKWAGGAAVVLSIITVEYFFLAPLHSFALNRDSVPLFLEFAGSSAVVSWFSSWRKRVEGELQHARDDLQARVEARTAELRESNEQLKAEMAERRRAEEAYYEAQAELARVTKLSALGALAASISHEVNQPLAAIVSNADACAIWLAGEPPDLAEARAAVESIAQEGTRASEIVKHIRAMFRNETPERANLDVNHLIIEVCGLMQGQASRNAVEVTTELAASLPEACADRVQIQQVLMNLVLNGIEAMSTIEIRPRQLVIRSEMQDERYVLVGVRDSGPGITAADAKQIFDAFFTTKAQGMGMGLSICHAIIDAHGGRLWARPNHDYGAILQFTLPTVQQPEAQ